MVLDLAAAEEFLATLRQHLQGEGGLRLDASAVETLTLPCVQILLAAMRDHDQISIEQPSIEFANAFQDLGLAWTTGDASDDQEAAQRAWSRRVCSSFASRKSRKPKQKKCISATSPIAR